MSDCENVITSGDNNPVSPGSSFNDSFRFQNLDSSIYNWHQIWINHGPRSTGHLELTGYLFWGVHRVHGCQGYPDGRSAPENLYCMFHFLFLFFKQFNFSKWHHLMALWKWDEWSHYHLNASWRSACCDLKWCPVRSAEFMPISKTSIYLESG